MMEQPGARYRVAGLSQSQPTDVAGGPHSGAEGATEGKGFAMGIWLADSTPANQMRPPMAVETCQLRAFCGTTFGPMSKRCPGRLCWGVELTPHLFLGRTLGVRSTCDRGVIGSR